MNRPILLLSTIAALAATAAFAQAPSSPAAPSGGSVKDSSDTTKLVCRSQSESGSRLNRRRVCVTQAEWDEQQRVSRMDVEKAQTNRSWCKNGPC